MKYLLNFILPFLRSGRHQNEEKRQSTALCSATSHNLQECGGRSVLTLGFLCYSRLCAGYSVKQFFYYIILENYHIHYYELFFIVYY